MTQAIQVVGAVIVRDGHVFCARRGPGGNQAGMWEFPGGKVEDGEAPEAALTREIDEELECAISVGAKIVATPYANIVLTTYFCVLDDDTAEPVLTEHVESRWLSHARLAGLDWAPADIPTVQRVMHG